MSRNTHEAVYVAGHRGRRAPQPLREDTLLIGVLEATNEPYAIAKIA